MRLALLFLLLTDFLFIGHTFAQQAPSDERLELEICRKSLPELRARLDAAQENLGEEEKARSQYNVAAYRQRVAIGDVGVRAFEWQLFAGNIILCLVALLTISGVGLGTYQLITATKVGRLKNGVAETHAANLDSEKRTSEGQSTLSEGLATTIELSSGRVSLQTSIVGLVVLFISWGFLLLFLHEVYPIKEVGQEFSPAGTSESTSGKSQ